MKDITNTKRSLREVLPTAEPLLDNRSGSEVISNHIVYRGEATDQRPNKTTWISLAVILAVLVIGGLAVRYLAVMRINITPKELAVKYDDVYQASRDELIYDVVSKVEETASVKAPASGLKKVERRATGQVTIANNFSSANQSLVKGTRLETTAGKIYRLQTGVIVPGKKGDQLGLVTVSVAADQPGPSYNNPAGDLKLVGFRGTNKYDKFIARVATGSKIDGGFSGEEKVVSAADKDKALNLLRSTLAAKIIAKAQHQIPDKYILFKDMAVVNYEEVAGDVAGVALAAGETVVTVRASLQGIIFDRGSLLKFLADKKGLNLGAPAQIADFQTLVLTLDSKYNIATDFATKVKFAVVGEPVFVAQFDQKELLTKLGTVARGQFSSVFAQFPAIGRASVDYQPALTRYLLIRPLTMKLVIKAEK